MCLREAETVEVTRSVKGNACNLVSAVPWQLGYTGVNPATVTFPCLSWRLARISLRACSGFGTVPPYRPECRSAREPVITMSS